MLDSTFFAASAFLAVFAPSLLAGTIGLCSLLNVSLREQVIGRLSLLTNLLGLVGIFGVAGMMIAAGRTETILEFGHWVILPEEHFHFHLKFVFDRLSVPLATLSYLLCGTVAAFASNYLHREAGYQRFFLFYALFSFGLSLSFLASTIEVLFFGWELVGLASALLVGFFHERRGPVNNGLRVWAVYRISDALFLVAVVMMHHLTGEGDFDHLTGQGAWPNAVSLLSGREAFSVGGLLLLAAAAKSALIPFSGWLPRAMEGPTPSSAIFYGALSIHLGAFLLLRVSPLIANSAGLTALVIAIGLATAIVANLIGRVQADIKGVLAFSALTQVGLIVVEIGMGWYYLALTHIIGHAFLRTLQLLRASNLLQDYFNIETAVGRKIAMSRLSQLEDSKPAEMQPWLYRFGLERGYLDLLLDRGLVAPWLEFFRWCSRLESNGIAWFGNQVTAKFHQPGEEADA